MALLSRMVRGWARRLMAGGLCLAALLAQLPDLAAQPLTREREVQAIFLLNLARFVRWPEAVFATDHAALVIGILPEDPLGPILDEAASGESVGNRPVVIRRIHVSTEIEGCHVVHFPRSQIGSVVPLIVQLHTRPVLMVSDAEGFLRLGGHVQMFNRGGQVKLRLDVENLKRAELTASAQLLRVAEIVKK